MTRRVWQIAILTGLVATPVADAIAQTNPWYIPPRQTQVYQQHPYGEQQPAYQQHQQVYQQPLAYQQVQHYGLGAGYTLQPQPPALAQPTGVQYWQQQRPAPATTGAVTSYPLPSGAVTYAQPPQQTYQLQRQATYPAPQQQPQIYVQPQVSPPQQQVIPQPQFVQPYQAQPSAPGYLTQPQVGQVYQPQLFGSYPPLGVDVTQLSAQPNTQPVTQPVAVAPAPAQIITPYGTTPIQAPYFAGQYGATTMSPGFGGFGGIGGMPNPSVFAPFGASSYLGLPFY